MNVIRPIALACATVLALGTPVSTGLLQAQDSAAVAAFAPLAGAIPAGQVNASHIGQTITIEGRILEAVESTAERTPHQLVLAKNGGQSVMVIYWPDLATTVHGAKGFPAVGTRVSASGQVGEYRGNLQLRVRNAGQIRLEGYAPAAGGAAPPPRAAAPAPAAAVSAELPQPGEDGYFTLADLPRMGPLKGSKLSLRGTTSGYRASWSPTAPNVVELTDGPNKMEVVFWTTEGEKAPDFSQTGTPIYAAGTFAEYRERIQLRVEDLASLSTAPLPPDKLLRPAAPTRPGSSVAEGWPGRTGAATRPATVTLEDGSRLSLREIGPQHAGNTVTVEGTVQRADAVGGSLVVILRDGQGHLRVNAPGGTTPPAVGSRLRAVGKLGFHALRSATELDVADPASMQPVAAEP